MKTLITITLICICMASSCTYGDKFSCDEEIDLWAHQNQEYFESAPRATIVSLPLDLQQAVYVSLSAGRKYELWNYKYQLLLESDALSDAEKQEIKKLFDVLGANVYKSPRKMKKFESFAQTWADGVVSQYGWDKTKLFYTVCTWMTEDEFNKSALSEIGIKDIPPGQEKCTCIYSIGCGAGFTCNKVSCQQIVGCGIAGTSNCNGRCL